MLIGYLSVRARKFKRKEKSCLLFVYPAGLGSLKERQKSCLLFVYPAGLGSLKEGLKVVYCLFIQQCGKFKRKAKICLLFVYQHGREDLKRPKVVNCYLSGRAV